MAATKEATKKGVPVVTYPTRATDGNEQDHGFGSLNVHSIGNAILRQAAEANEELRKNMTANISEFMRSGATLHRGGATLPQGGSLGALGRHGATLPSRHGRLYQTGINKKLAQLEKSFGKSKGYVAPRVIQQNGGRERDNDGNLLPPDDMDLIDFDDA